MSRQKSPTRAQLSSKLAYEKKVPAFLQKLKNKIDGVEPDYDEDEPAYEYDGEFESVDSSRPPIPRRPQSGTGRPPIPERPEGDPGSADEDDADEKPQVVVLKKGKHLSEWEVENERRIEKGLQPLPNPNDPADPSLFNSTSSNSKSSTAKAKEKAPTMSFSSKSSTANSTKSTSNFKRKVLGDVEERLAESKGKGADDHEEPKKKKSKKNHKNKTLLSFGDDA